MFPVSEPAPFLLLCTDTCMRSIWHPHFNYTMASDSSDCQVQVRQVNTSSKSKQIAQVSLYFSSTIFMLDRKYAVEDSTYPARTVCEPFAKGQISLPSFLPSFCIIKENFSLLALSKDAVFPTFPC